jgi:hypothetical protein
MTSEPARPSRDQILLRQTVAFVGGAIVAGLTAFSLEAMARDPTHELIAALGSPGIRAITSVVFIVALGLLSRGSLAADEDTPDFRAAANLGPGATPTETADAIAGAFGVTDDASRRYVIREALAGVPVATVMIPLLAYIRFGRVGPLGWGLMVFLQVYCLLKALGLWFRPRTEWHTKVRARGGWADRIGAFWLVGCAFGPFFGWIVTEALPITPGSWHWLYGLRLALAAGVPVLLALPLLRYARGKAALVALPLLAILTSLPVSTAMGVSQDLWEGPSVRQLADGGTELYLTHTERSLGPVH